MDNPWGSPWAADDSRSSANDLPTAGASGSTLPSLDRLPSPARLAAVQGFGSSATTINDDDDGGWGSSLNDGGWGGAEDAVSGRWGASTSSARASAASGSDDADAAPPVAELEFEPSSVPTLASFAQPIQDGEDDIDSVDGEEGFASAAVSPVFITPATATPVPTASPPAEPSPFASSPPPPSAPLPSDSPILSKPLSPSFPSADPPDAFASSDSFDDFAPFSSPPTLASSTLAGAGAEDDPWAATAAVGNDDDDGWGSSTVLRADAGDGDVPWSVEPPVDEGAEAASPKIVEDEWAEARRRAAIRAQRAPREVIERLTGQWSELACTRHPDPAAPKLSNASPAAPAQSEGVDDAEGGPPSSQATAAEEEAPGLTEVDEHLNLRLEDLHNIVDLLPKMLAPPESTTLAYPSSATHAQFIAALRLSLRLSNSASLLNTGRTRPLLPASGPSASSSPQLTDEWWDRSRLGEEEDRVDVSEGGEEKRGWFGAWSRRSSAQPVSARGGSVDAGSNSKATLAPERPPSTAGSATRPSVDRAASPSSSAQPTAPASVQASPRPSLSLSSEPPIEVAAEAAGSLASTTAAPSAVSRFLGRFSRKPTTAVATAAGKGPLELSAGDFDFLAEVQGAEGGRQADDDGLSSDQGDFLSGFGVPVVARGQQAALDDFLSPKSSVALPKPLAPPPGRVPSRPSSAASHASSLPRPPASAALDDLSFLSFDEPSPPLPPPPSKAAAPAHSAFADPSAPTAAANDDWDDFMASSTAGPASAAAKPAPQPSVLAPPIAPSRSASPATQMGPPTLATQSPAGGPSPLFPALTANSTLPLASTRAVDDEEDDFGDFSGSSTAFPVPALPTSGGFDAGGFDDFDTFASTPAPAGQIPILSPARLPPSMTAPSMTASTGAPEPPSKSPRHAQALSAAASRWPPTTADAAASSLAPSPTALRSGFSSTSAATAAAAGSPVAISNMATLVSHARTASQTTHRGWSTSPTVPVQPLPLPLAPPPPPRPAPSVGAGGGGARAARSSLMDDAEPPRAAIGGQAGMATATAAAAAAAAGSTTTAAAAAGLASEAAFLRPLAASVRPIAAAPAPSSASQPMADGGTSSAKAAAAWSPPVASATAAAAGSNRVGGGGGGGLSAADLDFFDGL